MSSQGFDVGSRLRLPSEDRKTYKKIQNRAKMMQVAEHGKFLLGFLERARECHLDGKDVIPESIDLELREVRPASHEERLFRWWNMVWWSMPYQHAYGRQMRFMLWDRGHDAPFGLVHLQSPLLRMKSRDDYLDIPTDSLDRWANMSMSAQRIGALPPYNDLIGGKMAALAVTSDNVRAAYRNKYEGRKTVMEGRVLRPDLLFVTTTGAFGKSSMYDRLKYGDEPAAIRIGHTQGTGTFHMPDHLVQDMYAILRERGVNTSTSYGHGPSRKVRLCKAAFSLLGLGGFYTHGIRREIYLFPLAENIRDVIHGGAEPAWINRPFDAVVSYWKKRWGVPRAGRLDRWRKFDKEAFFRGAEMMIRAQKSRTAVDGC